MAGRVFSRAALLGAMAGGLAAQPAQAAEKLISILSDDAKTIVYTPCGEEEAAECVTHDLTCRDNPVYGNGLSLTVLGGEGAADIRKPAAALIAKPYGEALVTFLVGAKAVDLPVQALSVSNNEMNGDLDLSLHFLDTGAFFDALRKDTAEAVAAEIAGMRVVLSAGKGDAAKLLKFKAACTR